MIGKPITGKSFGGCVRYLVGKEMAHILEADGVRIQSARSIIQDFNMQRKMNPALGKAVGHTINSWSAEDHPKLTEETMLDTAREYMQAMDIRNTQYMIVKHTDTQHPHLHIVYIRVDNDGKTISGQNNFKRNENVCRTLTSKHWYYMATGKVGVKRHRLKGADKLKYAIHDAINLALKSAKSWRELEQALHQKGIAILNKYKGETDQIQGISFEKDSVKFKGSAINRSFSYAGIENILKENVVHLTPAKPTGNSFLSSQASTATHPITKDAPASALGNSILEILFDHSSGGTTYDPVEQALKRKKKKRKRSI
jgi:hypothetical protein